MWKEEGGERSWKNGFFCTKILIFILVYGLIKHLKKIFCLFSIFCRKMKMLLRGWDEMSPHLYLLIFWLKFLKLNFLF